MSVTIFTASESDDSVRFHNGFGWFLDSLFGDQELPARFFSQAIASHPDTPDPGPLTAEQSAAFADALDNLDDDVLEQRMWAALNGAQADSSMRPAIDTVRDIARLARSGAQHDGLHVR